MPLLSPSAACIATHPRRWHGGSKRCAADVLLGVLPAVLFNFEQVAHNAVFNFVDEYFIDVHRRFAVWDYSWYALCALASPQPQRASGSGVNQWRWRCRANKRALEARGVHATVVAVGTAANLEALGRTNVIDNDDDYDVGKDIDVLSFGEWVSCARAVAGCGGWARQPSLSVCQCLPVGFGRLW